MLDIKEAILLKEASKLREKAESKKEGPAKQALLLQARQLERVVLVDSMLRCAE